MRPTFTSEIFSFLMPLVIAFVIGILVNKVTPSVSLSELQLLAVFLVLTVGYLAIIWLARRRHSAGQPGPKEQPASSGPYEYDVFLCHNSADKPRVLEIGERLKKSGLRPWLDEWSLRPGLNWQEELKKQMPFIKSAAVFVGQSGLGPWQTKEIKGFLQEFVRRESPVIPVILEDCTKLPKLPKLLTGRTWVDFRKTDPEPLARLIYGITGERPAPSLRLRRKLARLGAAFNWKVTVGLVAVTCLTVAGALFVKATESTCWFGSTCYNAGLKLAEGPLETRDYKKANEYFQRACDKDHAEGCTWLGLSHDWARGTELDIEHAATLYQRACELGSGRGCNAIGRAYSQGRGRTLDINKANQYFEKGCGLGNGFACYNLAESIADGKGVAKAPARAEELYKKAAKLDEESCNSGEGRSCTYLGVYYVNGEGVAKDLKRAKELYEQACKMGDGPGCAYLGWSYENGEGVAKDLKRAKELYEQACKMGDGRGCTNLGVVYENGTGVAKDLERAKELYEQACKMGNGLGCTYLGVNYEYGIGVKKDLKRANQLYEQACKMGNGRGCKKLGVNYENGTGVAKDLKRAKELFRQACSLGDEDACKRQ